MLDHKISRPTSDPFNQQVADLLRKEIVAGALEPGQRLTEAGIAAKIGISKSTTRAAFFQLASEGLVVLQPYTGWSVSTASLDDAWEVYTLRKELDGLAAELAAKRADNAGKTLLRDRVDSLRARIRGERLELAYADADFHHTIVKIARHKRLESQYNLIASASLLYIVKADLKISIEKEEKFLAEHRAICEAICDADAVSARALAEEHVEKYSAVVRAKIESKHA